MTEETKNDLASALLPALISALLVCVVRYFTIPWSIWKGAALRLAALRNKDEARSQSDERSEFPVFDWLRKAWDGVIFLSWFVGVLAAVVLFFVVTANYYGGFFGSFFAGIGALLGTLIYTYFSVIFISLLKESLILILSIALNVERLANKKSD